MRIGIRKRARTGDGHEDEDADGRRMEADVASGFAEDVPELEVGREEVENGREAIVGRQVREEE